MKIISVNEHPERKEPDDNDPPLPSFAEKLRELERLAAEREAKEKMKQPINDIEETSGEYWWQKL